MSGTGAASVDCSAPISRSTRGKGLQTRPAKEGKACFPMASRIHQPTLRRYLYGRGLDQLLYSGSICWLVSCWSPPLPEFMRLEPENVPNGWACKPAAGHLLPSATFARHPCLLHHPASPCTLISHPCTGIATLSIRKGHDQPDNNSGFAYLIIASLGAGDHDQRTDVGKLVRARCRVMVQAHSLHYKPWYKCTAELMKAQQMAGPGAAADLQCKI